MIDNCEKGLACALGVVGTLLVLSNVLWGGWMFLAISALAFWRPLGTLTGEALDLIESVRDRKRIQDSILVKPGKS